MPQSLLAGEWASGQPDNFCALFTFPTFDEWAAQKFLKTICPIAHSPASQNFESRGQPTDANAVWLRFSPGLPSVEIQKRKQKKGDLAAFC